MFGGSAVFDQGSQPQPLAQGSDGVTIEHISNSRAMGAGASAMPDPKEVSDEQIKDHIWGLKDSDGLPGPHDEVCWIESPVFRSWFDVRILSRQIELKNFGGDFADGHMLYTN